MSAETPSSSSGYLSQLALVGKFSLGRLLRRPQTAPDASSRRRLWRELILVGAIGIGTILVLMVTFDAYEIGLMPPRGTPSLWPWRIVTEFGQDEYVLGLLAIGVVVTILVAPLWPEATRSRLLNFATHVQFFFFAVLTSVLSAQALKYIIGRGRPFVGGKANAFNFDPFNGTPAYFSMPSAHAVTAFALAFAMAAVWPRLRVPMFIYAVVIAFSRLVLLAHHPSDVVAGAVVGLACAMLVRYWFAARRLGFRLAKDGQIVPR
ncbi:phosphatase PAP2 family protein [Bradyrhizobium sp. 83012]|uniref:Phosphatase PAP2 family protein n=1 Tax=Bradyrhizobium aeschynomenes TaxID=2734909 RepID=A0ABX2C6L1_9BRAD|nr:phosphatase PAP2 family protein [Bradyrhizobium aeschynomenes]NPU12864.1 phosphatase PAP2 family protein [Bradyrhizobium aeschynomenes]NPU63911.1 phosphatase PAP2 family protein [Bradyrhizobium aeschynomenes]NPV23186.1 phosphatase PAP2 family protein [Bradyrhizobium aeschynomenes]